VIFPGIMTFKPLKQNENTILFYCQVSFFPLKNRDYFVGAKYFETENMQDNRKWTLEWFPVADNPVIDDRKTDKFKRVKNINGRWIVQSLNNDKIKISVEYYNDWEVAVNNDIKIGVEKTTTVNALKNLLKYLGRDKGK
jgi:hypothetical protein